MIPALGNFITEWAGWPEALDVLLLQNYNTRLVVLSTTLLGIASGIIGSFLLLRKRSLMGDALSHACLPGIGLAFIILVAFGGEGKYLPGLLLGALVTGLLGVGMVIAVRNTTRLKDDAAMGVVLSVFFGLGIAIMGLLQKMPGASAAGLEHFIYGKAASMVLSDFGFILTITVIVIAVSMLFLKEFVLLCFDDSFAATSGWSVTLLDMILLLLVAAITVVGLQAVGLILIIAFLITPAAAARFWTDDLRGMLVWAGILGGLSGWIGASVSALLPNLPAGSLIVLVGSGLFLFSMIFGNARGILKRYWKHLKLKRKVGRQHLLRSVFEIIEAELRGESREPVNMAVSVDRLQKHRTWTPKRLHHLIKAASKEDHIESFDAHTLRLSEAGFGEAARTTRNHRLWELYLISYADIAPSHVDRDADSVEHILNPDMVRELEARLLQKESSLAIPRSPHQIEEKGVTP